MEPLEQDDPRVLGSFRILARIGSGGMAAVYLARSRGGRAVAVKVMHAELAREQELRARFGREVAAATAAGGVHSPPVLGADPQAATPWMATAFLPSLSLREAVDRFGALPAGTVRRLAAGLAEALAALHRAGIAHLDVNPANVLLTAEGPRLIDFGIAAPTTAAADPDSHGPAPEPHAPHGPPGTAGEHPAAVSRPAGTWGFMSPEQVAGTAGAPSDVYSLGATLEYALGGRPGTDGALRELIGACRRPEPADRPTAAELTRRLAAPAADAERPGAPWLPPAGAPWLAPALLAAIDAKASAADNPPLPAALPPRRRLLLTGAAVLVAAATGTVFAVASGGGSEGAPGGRARPGRQDGAASDRPGSSGAAASPAPSPAARRFTLEFVITGDGPLTSLAYAVNGTFTVRKDVRLSWRTKVEVTSAAGSVDWRLRFTIPAGRARCRVLVNGVEKSDETYPLPMGGTTFPYPYDVDTGGAVAIAPGPLPGTGG
ncbi:hypothetical protein GCM10018793_05430 [Streptomyces sulfonofaciens]|uniref:Protein kinase domain-containing protein n=1 Tax=Streptomyces sulfonofaciens TaxID=68272 RepID=A0A919FRY2_9ACTN|nr:protein kinase [Streptomyces sulfonofaciens]GHH70814.1 hypothetical protein GCM10018793_05430 [Streptomyces sulfonofaciens]